MNFLASVHLRGSVWLRCCLQSSWEACRSSQRVLWLSTISSLSLECPDLCSASSVVNSFSCFFLLTFMVTAFLSDANKTVVSPFFLGGACHFKTVQLIWLPCNFRCLMGSWKVLIHRLSSFLLLLGWNLHFLAVVYILSGSSALVVDKFYSFSLLSSL